MAHKFGYSDAWHDRQRARQRARKEQAVATGGGDYNGGNDYAALLGNSVSGVISGAWTPVQATTVITTGGTVYTSGNVTFGPYPASSPVQMQDPLPNGPSLPSQYPSSWQPFLQPPAKCRCGDCKAEMLQTEAWTSDGSDRLCHACYEARTAPVPDLPDLPTRRAISLVGVPLE